MTGTGGRRSKAISVARAYGGGWPWVRSLGRKERVWETAVSSFASITLSMRVYKTMRIIANRRRKLSVFHLVNAALGIWY